ncbi:MAG: phosphoribosyltransferase [Candidatus Bathyarchaeota archaeon]|nr:MAG: phosphoribosyltransferase [Candidatus Bathyarchaeota archaeon]
MNSEPEFEVPTWEQIYELLLNLADSVRKANFKPDVIVGVSRGGWPPARIISDLLEKSELANVKAEFYRGLAKTKGEPMITQPVSTSVTGKKVLVVDEVVDTGKSLRLVQSHLKERDATEVKILTIYYKPWSVVVPDWYGKETKRWVVFPWEIKETTRQGFNQCKNQGKTIEEAVEKLVQSGLNRKLVERFIQEISEGQI